MTREIKRTVRRNKALSLVLLSVLSLAVGLGVGKLVVGSASAKPAPAPPAPSITGKPANPSYSTSASFTFTDSASVSFSCQLDGTGFTACGNSPSGSASYPGLAVGTHVFQVKATSGSDSPVTSYSWSVAVVPAPSITAKPSNPSFSGAASFSYSDTVAAATFQCTLDGSPAACPGTGSGSASYTGLTSAPNPHVFSVRAVTDPPLLSAATSYSWTVEIPPPAPSILAHPADPTNQTSATFSFSGSGASFKCSLDGGAFGPCSSPKVYTGLADRSHSFQVEAVGPLGGTSAPASFAWTVDTKPPTVTTTFAADHGLYTAGEWNAGCFPLTTGFCGTATDPLGVSAVQLSIQRLATGLYWNGTAFAASTQTWVPASNTLWWYGFPAAQFPADGDYVVNARATDNAGNTTSAPDYVHDRFTIDTTPPPGPTFQKTPTSPTTETKAHFDYQDAEKDVKFQCSLDGGTSTNCGDKKDYDHLSQGSHTFCVVAIDKAGNVSPPSCFAWQIGAGGIPFTIHQVVGSADGITLGETRSVAITIDNPNSVPIYVTQLTVALTANAGSGTCSATNFSPTSWNAGSSVDELIVPANATNFAVPSGDQPQLTLVPDPDNSQDDCKTKTFTLSFGGSAHS
jgi:hypothetical protein